MNARNRGPQASRWLATVLVAAATAACHYEPKVEANAVPRPDEYKEVIQDYVRAQFTDPTGIRNAFISVPVLRTVASATPRYVVCFKFEAKDNETHRYSGQKEIAAIFYDGRINQYTGSTPELCGQASYQPFTELQKLCREKICPR